MQFSLQVLCSTILFLEVFRKSFFRALNFQRSQHFRVERVGCCPTNGGLAFGGNILWGCHDVLAFSSVATVGESVTFGIFTGGCPLSIVCLKICIRLYL